MTEVLYLNGEYVPSAEAKISVFDRGFMYGDGVYEVIPVYSGMLLRGRAHLARLQTSLDELDIVNPLTIAQWMEIFSMLIAQHGALADNEIYIQVTRGTMAKRDHGWSEELVPNVLITCRPQIYPQQDTQTLGERAVTLVDTRWSNAHIKTTNLLSNALLLQKARSLGASEAILIRNDYAVDGTQSNLFIVDDDIIITPPKSNHMLGGITREIVLDICQQNKLICREKDITEDELHDADEIWMSSSSREIVPISTLNQHAVGKGKPGPIWMQMIQLYQEYKIKIMRAPAV
ncbi:MAG: D-alanine transaminase [Candidatus Azotimanducaceae bacterium]|jgi:D-alanine transaminase